MFVIKNKNIFFTLSVLLVVASFVVIGLFGITPGIDFTGGSILEINYTTSERPAPEDIEALLSEQELLGSSVRFAGDDGYVLRTRFLEDSERAALVEALAFGQQDVLEVERFSSVGPTIGAELRQKAWIAIAVVVLAIILFVAYAFRGVRGENEKKPLGPSSWTYGLTAIIALVHDIIIPTGVFAIVGYVTGAQIDILFVMALLAILGFSVNDTIVVFDRVRENLIRNRDAGIKETFEETVGKSLNQTYTRSLNTSLTTLVVLIALFVLSGGAVHNFVLTLIAGVIIGTYSSIFLASPLLVSFAKKRKGK